MAGKPKTEIYWQEIADKSKPNDSAKSLEEQGISSASTTLLKKRENLYNPLNSSRSEIRLIEVISPNTIPIECSLSIVSLKDDLDFSALSYVWGDPTVTEDILLNGHTVAVTTNLANALRYVKRHWQNQYPDRDSTLFRLWADAICINQTDKPELSRQVQSMGLIYQKAELVLSWLGCTVGKVGLALNTFNSIANR